MTPYNRIVFPSIFSILITACGGSGGGGGGGGGSSSGGSVNPPASSPTPELVYIATKIFRFSWVDVSGATHYKLLENPDGTSGYSQVGENIAQGQQTTDLIVPLYRRINARYLLQTCNSAGCIDSAPVNVSGNLAQAIGYFKASNSDTGDSFGLAVSLSGDGHTLAVGAPSEASASTGIGGSQDDNSAADSGAVYIFIRSGNGWSQQAYIKAGNAEAGDAFGTAVSLSTDGNTLAVGALYEDSNAMGVDGNEDNNTGTDSGAVYLFTRDNGDWTQQAYIKASNTGNWDLFGSALSLAGDGNTLAVGAYAEDSNATGIGGDENNNNWPDRGAVYLFIRDPINSAWSQQAYIKASNTPQLFGWSVALSTDGNTLATGAISDKSNATGVNGDENNNSLDFAGAVYVFFRDNNAWSQQAYIKASNTDAGDQFGIAVSLSADGDTLAVGAPFEDSNAIGGEADDSMEQAGAAYIYARNGGIWDQQAYIKASNAGAGDFFGYSLSLSGDGDLLAVGAVDESGSATGLNGDENNNDAGRAGASYFFTRDSGVWSQQAYIKASNSGELAQFGWAVSLSADANTLAVGAYGESGNATGINSDASNSGAFYTGAVYLY